LRHSPIFERTSARLLADLIARATPNQTDLNSTFSKTDASIHVVLDGEVHLSARTPEDGEDASPQDDAGGKSGSHLLTTGDTYVSDAATMRDKPLLLRAANP